MPASRLHAMFRPSLTLLLFGVVVVSLWVAGGASRADALGQTAVRTVAWASLLVAIIFGSRDAFAEAWRSYEVRPVAIFLLLALLLALAQLVPLPPGIWQELPGRAPLAEAAALAGQAQPWRPLSIVPDATINAATSLIVPFVVLLLIGSLNREERGYVPDLLLAFIATSVIVGMLQFSVGMVDNIFINETRDVISGTFANRNHFALLLAIGCVLTPAWAAFGHARSRKLGKNKAGKTSLWRMAVAGALVVLFLLMILVSGSRAGLALGIGGALLGLIIAARAIREALSHFPGWAYPAVIGAILTVIVLCVLVSLVAGRAESIDRIVQSDRGQDMRVLALPVVMQMVRDYFPVGAGLGGFDPLFRMYEPDALLKPTYFNNAHNDVLELVLLTGVPGVLLMVAAVGWWAWTSFRAWGGRNELARAGSAILLLIMLASIFDYPARTPAMMMFIVIGAVWLAGAGRSRRSALPEQPPHL